MQNSPAAGDTTETAPSSRAPVALVIALALVCGAALTWGRLTDVWTSGAFFDTDDAMRMVQVRNLLGGQDWFDMNVGRMDPPAGVFMHWSRTVDVPLALLMKFFGLFTDAATAEALTRIVFPLALAVALYVAVARLAALFGGVAVQVAAVGLAFATGEVFTQFVPGRIDHHAPQIVLLVLMSAATLSAFEPSRAKLADTSALLAALSLSISIENLPFILVLAAAQPLAWIIRGQEQVAALRYYALGLASGLLIVGATTIAPARWFVPACDALSLAHIAPAIAGAAGLLVLCLVSARLASLPARLGAACVLGLAPLVALKLVAPECLGDPFVGLDPLVRAIWLDHVGEVQKLIDLAQTQPTSAITIGVPVALALAATLVAALFSRGLLAARLWLLAALIAAGLAMTFWGVRVFSSVAPLAAVGGAFAAAALARRLIGDAPLRGVMTAALSLPFAPFAFALGLPSDPPGAESKSLSCLRPEAVKPLDALAPGLVLAPIDEGSHLLAFTRHSVIAAPYHRDNHGNRLVLVALLARPADAEPIVRASGADYVVICPALRQAQIIAERAPDGLAAALIAGRAPDWLTPLEAKAAPNLVYAVKRGK